MQNEDLVRVGFIGAGAICEQRHLPNLKALGHVAFVSVCNRSEQSSTRIAEKWGFKDIDNDWRELIARDDIDAVFIGTWPYTHAEMAVAALEAGKHVFCQARMAANLEQATQMLEAADAHGHLVDMICPPPHRMPYEPYIKQVLADGVLGDLREVRLVCRNAGDVGELNWRQRTEYSGQQIMQVGIWAETLNAWLGEYEELRAEFESPIDVKPDPENDGVDYELHIPQVVKLVGWLKCGVFIQEDHSGIAIGENANHLTITGDKGAMRIHYEGDVEMAKVGEMFHTVGPPVSLQRDWQVEKDFIDAIYLSREGVPACDWGVSPDFAEGYKYMKKMDAIWRAAQSNEVVIV
ncbi:Gfo/Idh/MocA family oxidoreductase [Planctomycetota bacterium]|nr:Gfo/Idh/MocA family oxidoreductase [Planctomycetota bacterium]